MSGAPKGLEKVWADLAEEAKGFVTDMLPHIQAVGRDKARIWVGHATSSSASLRGGLTAETLIYASLSAAQRKLWRDQSLEGFTGEVDRFVAAARALNDRIGRLTAVAADAVFRVLPMMLLA